MKWISAIGLSTTLIALAVVGASCGGDDDGNGQLSGMDHGSSGMNMNSNSPASNVTVNLSNWAMSPSSNTLTAGTVKFTANHEAAQHGMNDGGATHQLMVARLPDGAKAGQSKFSSIALNLGDIKPGESKSGEAQLTTGTYEVACLVVEQVNGKSVNHYEKGMYTTVVVK